MNVYDGEWLSWASRLMLPQGQLLSKAMGNPIHYRSLRHLPCLLQWPRALPGKGECAQHTAWQSHPSSWPTYGTHLILLAQKCPNKIMPEGNTWTNHLVNQDGLIAPQGCSQVLLKFQMFHTVLYSCSSVEQELWAVTTTSLLTNHVSSSVTGTWEPSVKYQVSHKMSTFVRKWMRTFLQQIMGCNVQELYFFVFLWVAHNPSAQQPQLWQALTLLTLSCHVSCVFSLCSFQDVNWSYWVKWILLYWQRYRNE